MNPLRIIRNIGRLVQYKAFTIAAVCLFLIGCEQQPEKLRHDFSGQTMGTYYRLSVIEQPNTELAGLQDAIDSILEQVNSQMSTYIKDSEISEFNTITADKWFEVSSDLVSVSQKAKQIYDQTGGLFDPTIAPLVNLWSFGPEHRPLSIPSDNELAGIRDAVGANKLTVRDQPPALKKSHSQLKLDLSAIAKGFAVDKIAEYLVSIGQENFIIDIGGELRALGNNVAGKSWRVGIEKPQTELTQSVQQVVSISGKSIATSGSYRNYFERNGKRYSHIINPQTGNPIEHKLVSVSVISDDCMSADAYATALMVLGPQQGYDFALQNGLAVYMIEKKDDEFESKFTPQMKHFMD